MSSPRTRRARALPDGAGAARSPSWNIARDLDEQTELGAVYARDLIRAQLRAALGTCALVGLVLAGLPLLLSRVPELNRVRVYEVPLPWLVLALGVQPVWVLLAARHVRRAERVERDFTRLVDRT
ncbi:hypothetical protein [Actinomadura hibisca]|uniref:hypothetical protein n=1 Tax=Actinomadura hibisca TaxID=68565 RepID=UPI0014721C00|nr:hypothetical protein [Actinomadura hibisca]